MNARTPKTSVPPFRPIGKNYHFMLILQRKTQVFFTKMRIRFFPQRHRHPVMAFLTSVVCFHLSVVFFSTCSARATKPTVSNSKHPPRISHPNAKIQNLHTQTENRFTEKERRLDMKVGCEWHYKMTVVTCCDGESPRFGATIAQPTCCVKMSESSFCALATKRSIVVFSSFNQPTATTSTFLSCC